MEKIRVTLDKEAVEVIKEMIDNLVNKNKSMRFIFFDF